LALGCSVEKENECEAESLFESSSSSSRRALRCIRFAWCRLYRFVVARKPDGSLINGQCPSEALSGGFHSRVP
jgi:hypothetical protein